jgi:DNA-binding SARP family transcriptional activator
VIGTEADGYRLRTARIDLGEVVDAQTSARAEGRPETAVTTLRAALKLWRGAPLSGISPHLAALQRPRLDELRLSLLEDCLDAELACGHAAQVVPELTELVRAHPLREELYYRRMLALYRCGRRADALDAFRQARQVLREELGVDPPRELVELELEILAADPAPPRRAGREVPAQLPPRTRGFAGRETELATLGDAAEHCCDVPAALAALDDAAACYEASGNVAGLAGCHSSLSTLHRDQIGDPDAALRHARKALRHAESLGEWKITAQAKVGVVHVSLAVGDLPSARRHAADALALAERHGDPVGRTWCLIVNARALRESGDLAAARSFADRALPLARQTRRPDAEAAIHVEYARIDRAAGSPAAALPRARTALELAGKFDSPVERGRIEQLLTELAAE